MILPAFVGLSRRLQVLVCLFLIAATTCTSTAYQADNAVNHKDDDFDYFVFSQEWPETIYKFTSHPSKINKNVTTWTIHGLWPTKDRTKGPHFCGSKNYFDPSPLNPIWGKLMKYWPNAYTDETVDSLWFREWCKHGVCASSMPDFGSEFDYFNQALKLGQRLNIYSQLQKNGIVPTKKQTYRYTDVQKALMQFGAKVILQCYHDKKKTQYLAQIEMCVSKELKVINCTSHHMSKRSLQFTQRQQPQQLLGTGRNQAMKCRTHDLLYSGDTPRLCSQTKPLAYTPIEH